MSRRRLPSVPSLALICALFALLALPVPALARVALQSSNPPADAVLVVSPSEVVLTFSAAVEPAYSFVAVLDGSGRRLDDGHMDRDSKSAAVVHVPLFAQAQGTCQVNWRMVGADGRAVNGSFTFAVVP